KFEILGIIFFHGQLQTHQISFKSEMVMSDFILKLVDLAWNAPIVNSIRSEEHTSELQSRSDLVCRLLLEKKNHQNGWLHAFDGHLRQRGQSQPLCKTSLQPASRSRSRRADRARLQ